MIEGLKADISYNELVAHMEARRAHHLGRATHHRAQAALTKDKQLRETVDRKADGHTEKAEYFKVFADHLVISETYRLDYHDMLTIEMLSASDDFNF